MILLLAVLWLVRMLPSMIEVNVGIFMASVFVPLICAVLLLIWWAVFSCAMRQRKE